MPVDVGSLLDSLKRGDEGAVERLLEQVYPRVREMVHRKLEADFRRKHRWMLAQFSTGDIVQDVFLRVVGNLDQIRGRDEATLMAYLATAVHRRVLDTLRYHRRERRRDELRAHEQGTAVDGVLGRQATPQRSPTGIAATREQVQIFQAALNEFPERKRHLLRLRLEDELGFDDIALRLGYANANVASKAYRAALAVLLARLRSRGMKPTLPGEEGS